ncbi:MAG: chemotaxis protein CheA, partial [Elusimicrobiota bacterium]
MEETTRRRAPFAVLCARLTLAAFAATLPGPAVWAQAVARVAPLTASAGGAVGAAGSALSAPSFVMPAALGSAPSFSAPALSAAAPAAALIAGPA